MPGPWPVWGLMVSFMELETTPNYLHHSQRLSNNRALSLQGLLTKNWTRLQAIQLQVALCAACLRTQCLWLVAAREEGWGEETREAPAKLGNEDRGDCGEKRRWANSISLICMGTASQVCSQSCEKDQLIYQSAPLSAITYFPLANKKCVHYQAGPCPPKQPMRLYNYTSFLDNLHDCFPNSILLR